MPRLAIIGHSHTVAFLDAIADWRRFAKLDDWRPDGFPEAYRGWFSLAVDGAAFRFTSKPEFAAFADAKTVLFAPAANPWELAHLGDGDGGPSVQVSPHLQKCLLEISDCDTIVSFIHGWEVPAISLVNQHPDYDFAPYDDHHCRPIDYQFILGAIVEMVMKVVVPLRVIKVVMPTARIFHVTPPPPLEDPARAPYREQFADVMETYGVARAALRLKWHYAYREELSRMLMLAGMLALHEPPAALTAEGFLREEFSGSVTHANAAYGALVADRVRGLVFG